MKTIAWDEKKNEQLKQLRGVSFQDVLEELAGQGPLWIKEHPQRERYPGQRLLGVFIAGYVFVVPFEETDDKIILKTIYPSRRETATLKKPKGKAHDQGRR